MLFRSRWLLIVCLLVLGSGRIMAASAREERAFASATRWLQDGIWDRAETEYAQFIQKYPKSEKIADAVLAMAQAQCKQGKFTAAIATLSGPHEHLGALADDYAYWLGEAQFGQGDYDHAAATFTNLVAQFTDSPLRLAAVVEAASAFERSAAWPQITELLGATNGVFAHAAAVDAASGLVVSGRLTLAEAELALSDYAAALATLNLVKPERLPMDLAWRRANLVCRAQVGAKDFDAALTTASNLLPLARALNDPEKLADSVAWRGTVLEHLGRWQEAGAAWAENLTNSAPVDWQREALLRIAQAAIEEKQFNVAIDQLGAYVAQYSNSPAADLAQVTLGELELKEFVADPSATNQLADARKHFDQLLNANTNSPQAGKAHLDRGWYFWLAGQTNESLADFQAAVRLLPVSEDRAVAMFKTGDAFFVLGQFEAAQKSYHALLTQFGTTPLVAQSLGDRAWYQILRSNIRMTNAVGANEAMERMLKDYADSQLRDDGLLLLAEGFSDWGDETNALKIFEEFATIFPDSPLLPQVQLEQARILEHEQKWADTIACYDAWLARFPTNDLQPKVRYALAWVNYQAGNESNAFMQFTNFVTRFPTNDLAPLAQWWVADYYYRQGATNTTSFVDAEKNYELIFQTPAWQKSDLFYPAQLMAGRAAGARQGYTDAANYLLKLVNDTNCPETLKTEVKFAYGSVLMKMDSPDTNRPFMNFEAATNIFTQLCLANATNDLGALAASELGDCNLQLGALDAATNAFAQVVQSDIASINLRCRADVGWGRVLEKMAENAPSAARPALLAEARNHYLDAFELGYAGDGHGPGDASYVKRAGLLALPLLSANGNCPTNFISRMELLLPPLKETLEKKKAALEAGKN